MGEVDKDENDNTKGEVEEEESDGNIDFGVASKRQLTLYEKLCAGKTNRQIWAIKAYLIIALIWFENCMVAVWVLNNKTVGQKFKESNH